MVTPFMEVTTSDGQVMNAFQPLGLIRFKIPDAMNESNSLNPSKVSIAICIVEPFTNAVLHWRPIISNAN